MSVSDKKAQLLKAMLKKKGIASAKKNNTVEKINRIKRDSNSGLPLSYAQEQLWIQDQLFPGNPVYNIPVAVRIEGDIDVDVLIQSVRDVVGRHETLHTNFTQTDTKAVAIVNESSDLQVEVIKSADKNKSTKEYITGEIQKKARASFDLGKDLLIKATIWDTGNKECYLLVIIHHIVCDGWSVSILLDEIGRFYNDRINNTVSDNLLSLPIDYIDFAQWQRNIQNNDKSQKQLEYWKKKLSGDLPIIELPTDFVRPSVATFNGAIQKIQLSDELSRQLELFCKSNNITSFMLMLSIFNILINRYTGAEDILVGTPVNSRSQKELENIIGYFVNTVVLRADLSDNPVFADFLVGVRNTVLDAFDNQDTPLGKLADELKVGRNLSQSTIFQVMFSVLNAPEKSMQLKSAAVEQLSHDQLHTKTSKVDLNMVIEPGLNSRGDCWDIWLEYNADVFSPETISQLLNHYKNLLQSALQSADKKISELKILTAREENTLLTVWNTPQSNFYADNLLHHCFLEQVEKYPQRIALQYEDVSLSYAELDKLSNKLANHLIQYKTGPDVLVGLCLDRSINLIVGLLAILKTGSAYVPMDPAAPVSRLEFIIDDAAMPVVLTEKKYFDIFSSQAMQLELVDINAKEINSSSDSAVSSGVSPENIAYVIYTSGSTGKPKGVLVEHKNVIRLFSATDEWYKFTENDVWTLFHSCTFDFSVWEIWGALFYGAKLLVVPYWISRSPEEFHKYLREEKVTVLNQTPSAFKQLSHVDQQLNGPSELSLRYVIFGGEALDLESLRPWFNRHGDKVPQLINMYGITETTVHVTYRPISLADIEAGNGSIIGKPIADLQTYLLDKHLNLVPTGVTGEIFVAGAGVARGYLNRPALNEERFLDDHISANASSKLYRSGDLARYRPNGDMEYLGRIDDQVKIRGFRIELGEIESSLSSAQEVKQNIVIVQSDVSGTPCIVAFYIKNENKDSSAEMLRSYLRKNLPDYMIPQYFIEVENFALTSNGKIDRKALPLITDVKQMSETEYVAPRNSVEKELESIWSEVLGITEISIHENFFNIGGHSLLATQLISRIKNYFEIDLPLRSLFDASSIAELTLKVKALQSGVQKTLQPAIEKHTGNVPVELSFAQQRLWYLDQLEPENPVYNIPVIYQLSGELQTVYLIDALQTIYMRHQVLRTSFQFNEDKAAQVIDESPLNIEIINLVDQDEVALNQLIATESVTTFRLDQSPLIRIKLVKINATTHILMLVIHHSLFDGWSTRVLMNELSLLYSASVNSVEPLLPRLSIQYSDYALWQRNWLQGEVLQQQLDYWTAHLQGELPVLELPTDFARPSHFNYIGKTYSVELPEQLMSALGEQARGAGATPFMFSLAAYITLLYRYTGQTDIITGTIIANRNHAQTENLLGYFANTLAIRTQFDEVPSFSQLLAQVRENCLNAYTYQDLPFERLVEELNPDRELSHTPVYQTLFSYNSAMGLEPSLADIELKVLSIESQVARTDLSFSIEEDSNGGYRLEIEYCSDLFKEQSIARFTEHYINLLQSIVKTPQAKLYELPMLVESDFSIIASSNNTAKVYPGEQCIHHVISQQVKQTPQAIAISYNGDDLSYQQLEENSDKLAQHLATLNIKANQLIALCVNRSADMLVAMLAILKSGAAYLPLDPDYPADRIEFILEDADVSVILTETSVLDILPESKTKNILLDQPWDQQLPIVSADTTVTDVNSQNVAYTIYTSGSTGKPKGVLVPHGTVVNFLNSMAEKPGLKPGDVLLAVTTLSFDIAVLELFLPLFTGAKIELADREAAADGASLLEKISSAGVNVMQATPATWRIMLASGWRPGSELKVLCGGEAMPADLAAELLSHASSVWNMYGPTETTVWSTLYQITDAEQPILIGKPIANTQIHILDKNRQLLPAGVAGEMYIAGAGVTRGYLKRPDLTRERFLKLPINGAEPEIMYRTGDLVKYLADGNIEYINRLDNQVKVRGFRIELGEIENVLTDHKEVKQVVVIVREDRPGDTRLVAYYVSLEGDEISVTSLRKHLRAQLPDYMIPQHFVELDKLPVTPNGKINRQALPAPFSDGAGAEDFVAPSTENEIIIAEIWKEVLDTDKVSVNDNFFEIGGHSLLSVQVIGKFKEKTGIKLELRSVIMDTLGQIAAQCPQLRVESVPASGNEPVKAEKNLSLVDRIKLKVKSAVFKSTD